MATWYVDNSLHPAANAEGTAAGGGGDYILLADDGVQEDGAFNGYGVLITAGTGAGQQRRVIDYDHTGHADGERRAQVDVAWDTAPDATSTYEITVGCDRNTGAGEGPGASGAWRTIDHAMNQVSAGDTIHVRGGREYRETATVDTAGTLLAPIVVQGYWSVPGDAGDGEWPVTIAGEGTRANGVTTSFGPNTWAYWRFAHLRVIGGTGTGFDLVNLAGCQYLNCRAEGNGANGFSLGPATMAIGCEAAGNGGNGFWHGGTVGSQVPILLNATAHHNAGDQFGGSGMILIDCRAYGVAAGKDAVDLTSFGLLVNATLDGEGEAATKGVRTTNGALLVVVNTVVHEFETGLYGLLNSVLRYSRNNLFSGCATPRTNWPTAGGDVTGAPFFADEANDDYRLAAGSPAGGTGYPAYRDIGASQRRWCGHGPGAVQLGMQA